MSTCRRNGLCTRADCVLSRPDSAAIGDSLRPCIARAHRAPPARGIQLEALGPEPRVVVRGDAEQQLVQCPALLGVERCEELLLDALRERPELVERLVAFRR